MEELLASLPQKSLNLFRGQEVEGEVVKVTDKEVTLDLGMKAEGIIQGMASCKVGDKIKAFVLDPENESGQVVLTLVRASKKPLKPTFKSKEEIDEEKWRSLSQKYQVDDVIKGIVTKITQFGVFVKLEEGIEGLIHVSKLGPDDNFTVNQGISVVIDGVDSDKKRISLAPVLTSTKGLIYK